MTVLITIAAATITLVLVKQGLDAARNESNKSAAQVATMAAGDMRLAFEHELQKNPTFFLTEVYDKESPRICSQGEERKVYTPGQAWPSECGTSWEYEADPESQEVVKITPPGSSSSSLHVEYAVKIGATSMGLQTDYVPNSINRALIASSSDLDLNTLAQGDAPTQLGGLVYAKGNLTLPSDPKISSERAVYASDTLLTGEVPAGSTGVAPGDPSQSVRDFLPTPLSVSELKSSFSALSKIACMPANLNNNALCLQEGRSIFDSAGEAVTVPAAQAWMVLPSQTSEDLLELHYSNKSASYPNTCAADCSNILAESELSASGESHPGAAGFWTKLPGEFKYPRSGVLQSPATTYLGFCGAAFLDPEGACMTHGQTPETATFTGSLTVLAGSIEEPKDTFFSGSVASSSTSNLGVFSSGNVILPNWSHAPGKNLTLEAAITAIGDGNAPSVKALPLNPGNHSETEFSAPLEIKGALIGDNPSLPGNGFTSVKFSQDPTLLTSPAPYLGTGSLTWGEKKTSRLTPEQLFELF